MKLKPRLAIVLAAGIVAISCATPQSQELKNAQQSYSEAQNDAMVAENAPVILHEARQALDRAQKADSLEEQKHFAYLAQKKIELAKTQASHESMRAEAQSLQQQQQDFLLAIRQRQAEQARMEAQQSQQQLQAYRAMEQQQELTRAQREAQQARSELMQLQEEMADAKAQQTDRGVVLTLSSVVFEFDKALLKSGAERSLSQLSDFLKRHPDRKVVVEGFTDSIGSESYNRNLSEQRAEAVAQALEAEGISGDRITTRGLGENYPVATNNTEAGRLQNRRVEITILNPDQEPQNTGRNGGRM